MDMGRVITRHARYRPDHVGVVFEDQRFTWQQFNQQVNRLANALVTLGVAKGDKVVTLAPNCIELLLVYWAAAKVGAVSVPMSPLVTAKGLPGLLNDCDGMVIIVAPDLADTVNEARAQLGKMAPDGFIVTGNEPVDGFQSCAELMNAASPEEPNTSGNGDDDVFNIIYSSGTTGAPKGIVHTHYVRAMYAMIFSQAFRFTPESVCLHTGAVIFNGAFVTLMPTFYNGARYILHEHFDIAAVIETIVREQVTHIMMVPAQIIALLNHPNVEPEKLQSLQMILSLGAPLLEGEKQRLEALLPGRFYELYGLTEGFVTVLDKNDALRKRGSVGSCLPFFEMRICDENANDLETGQVGEIVGRGPMMMPGYYKRDTLTAETIVDGWLFTGDMGYVDEDGFLYLVDRKKDMIISGGVNVYPRDIEDIAARHDKVAEVAVFGIPDDKWGETPVAAILPRAGCELSASEMRDFINENVEARFQKVSTVLIKQEFPRSVAGKTLKRELREQYMAELAK